MGAAQDSINRTMTALQVCPGRLLWRAFGGLGLRPQVRPNAAQRLPQIASKFRRSVERLAVQHIGRRVWADHFHPGCQFLDDVHMQQVRRHRLGGSVGALCHVVQNGQGDIVQEQAEHRLEDRCFGCPANQVPQVERLNDALKHGLDSPATTIQDEQVFGWIAVGVHQARDQLKGLIVWASDSNLPNRDSVCLVSEPTPFLPKRSSNIVDSRPCRDGRIRMKMALFMQSNEEFVFAIGQRVQDFEVAEAAVVDPQPRSGVRQGSSFGNGSGHMRIVGRLSVECCFDDERLAGGHVLDDQELASIHVSLQALKQLEPLLHVLQFLPIHGHNSVVTQGNGQGVNGWAQHDCVETRGCLNEQAHTDLVGNSRETVVYGLERSLQDTRFLSMAKCLAGGRMMSKDGIGHEMNEQGEGKLPFKTASPMSIEDVREKSVLGNVVEQMEGRVGQWQPSAYFDTSMSAGVLIGFHPNKTTVVTWPAAAVGLFRRPCR